MFQNKKLKRNATFAIAEVAEVALCASNCALPTSGYSTHNNSINYTGGSLETSVTKNVVPEINTTVLG